MAVLFKFGLTYEQFMSLDYASADLMIKSRTKAEEERLNNNIIVGAKSALKVIQFYTGSRKANDLGLIDYNIKLFEQDTSDRELKLYRSQYNLLKSNNIDPIKFILQKEQEELHNAGK